MKLEEVATKILVNVYRVSLPGNPQGTRQTFLLAENSITLGKTCV